MKYREESRASLKILSCAEDELPFKFFQVEYLIKKEQSFLARTTFKYVEPAIPFVFAATHALIGIGIWFGLLHFGVAP